MARPCGLAHQQGGRRALPRRRAPARPPGAPPPGCARAAPPWTPARPPAAAQAASRARHRAPHERPTLGLPRKRPAAACAPPPCPTQPPRAPARQRGVCPRGSGRVPPRHGARLPCGQVDLALLQQEQRVLAVPRGQPQQRRLRGRSLEEGRELGGALHALRGADLQPLGVRRGHQLALALDLAGPAPGPGQRADPTSGASSGALLQTSSTARCAQKQSCEHGAPAAACTRPAAAEHAATSPARARPGSRRCCVSTLRACTRASCPSSAARTSARFSASSRCCATRVPLNALSSFLAAAHAPVGQRRGQAQAGLPSVRRPAGHSLLSARQLQGGRGLPTHRCGQTPWRVGGPRGGRRALELLQRAQQRAKHAAVALLHGRVGVVVLARPLGRAGRLGGRLAGRAPLSPLPAAPSQAEVQGLAQGGPRVSRTRQPQHPVIT